MDGDDSCLQGKEAAAGAPKVNSLGDGELKTSGSMATEQSPISRNNKKTARFTKGVSIDMGSGPLQNQNHQASKN